MRVHAVDKLVITQLCSLSDLKEIGRCNVQPGKVIFTINLQLLADRAVSGCPFKPGCQLSDRLIHMRVLTCNLMSERLDFLVGRFKPCQPAGLDSHIIGANHDVSDLRIVLYLRLSVIATSPS